MKRVVITGIGGYSCIGKNIEEIRDSLYAGRSGVGVEAIRKEYGYRSPLTGIVEIPNLKGLLDRHLRRGLSEEGVFAYMATLEAINNAHLDADYFDTNEAGIIYGNDSSAKAVVESHEAVKSLGDTTLLGSSAVFQSMNSTVTMNLATIFHLKGVNFTVSAACASGSHSIGLGCMFIRQGLQDMVICGGAQEVNAYSMASFDGLSAFSTRIDEPTKASRPFDASRDGLVPSGGAATVILEEYDHAKRRGAHIFGEVAGYGFSSNGMHLSEPSSVGLVKAIRLALDDAGLSTADIDYINAHATSTPLGDASEAMAINDVFGNVKPPVSSTKSMTGHECWMAGASEIVYSLLMMRDSFVAPNINFETPDEHSEKLNISTKTIDKRINAFLSNSFGFGGTNSVLIIKKCN